jgi:N6-adenosine-specific RNA methylase IME4
MAPTRSNRDKAPAKGQQAAARVAGKSKPPKKRAGNGRGASGTDLRGQRGRATNDSAGRAEPLPRKVWAVKILKVWQAALESIIETGRLLRAAKKDLDHGEFMKMVKEDIGFSISKAERLMKIAADARITDSAHMPIMPPCWGTLYEIAKLNKTDFKLALRTGIIRPDCERERIKVFRRIQANKRIKRANVITPEGTFATIFADPAWPDMGRLPYPALTMEELRHLGGLIEQKAAKNCFLFLCVPESPLELALDLIREWGWEFVSRIIWDKGAGIQPTGQPQITHEFTIIARRGKPTFLTTKGFRTCYRWPRPGEHSRKPPEMFAEFARVTFDPRLEMFSREKHDGWEQHGNEISKFQRVA